MRLRRAAALVVCALLLSSVAGAQGRRVSRRVLEAARDRGRVRVLVRTRPEGGFVPETRLRRRRDVERQRSAIQRARRALMDEISLADASLRVSFTTIPYVAVEVDEETLERLGASPLVDAISEDPLLSPSLASTIPLIGADQVWSDGYTGSGAAVAILDTGVEAGHPFFGGRVVSEACFSTNSAYYSATSLCPNGQSSMLGAGAASPSKCTGIGGCDHGTHVAGIAAGSGVSFSGVARDADIIAIQVFTRFDDTGICGGAGSCLLSFTSDQIAGLERIYALRDSYAIAAANLSLGGGQYTSTCDSTSPAYTQIVEDLLGVGTATVVASGNSGFSSATDFPGCISSVVTVGAIWDDDRVTSFSNSASWVDLLAPGGSVTSSVTGGGFGIKTGTSMATPHVTGAFALLKSVSPGSSPETILSALQTSGLLLTDPKSGMVTPRIRVNLAADVLEPSPPPVITTAALPDGLVGSPYLQTLDVTGGAPPLSFRLAAGALPGLSVDAATGTISGTPTEAGTFDVTFEVTDDIGRTGVKDLSLFVALPVPVPLEPLSPTRAIRPTFRWSASSGATGYELVVANITDGALVLNEILATTTFIPSNDLPSGKSLAWSVRALDADGDMSLFSAAVTFDIDVTPPSPSPLSVSPLVLYSVSAVVDSVSSSAASADWSAQKAFDADGSTAWSTLPTGALQDEFLVADLGEPRPVGRVELTSRVESGTLFPADFEIQLSTDGSTFVTVVDVTDFVADAASSYEFTFGGQLARFVRLYVTRSRVHTNGMHYVQLAEMQIGEPALATDTLVVRWEAPGDDAQTGVATSFDLRMDAQVLDEANFELATPVSNVPAPGPPGTTHSVSIDGLTGETRYFFGLVTTDDVGNSSSLTVGDAKTAGTPPDPVFDLRVDSASASTVELSWTATGDDGVLGTAQAYELRYSTTPITADHFGDATLAPTPHPATPGSAELVTVGGLEPALIYYFAVVVIDQAGNRSVLSNVVAAATTDTVPPAAIELSATVVSAEPTRLGGLVAVDASSESTASYGMTRTTDGDLATSWSTAPSRTPEPEHITWSLGSPKTIERVRLQSRDLTGLLFPRDYEIQVSPDGTSWTNVASASGVSIGAGVWVEHDFPPVLAAFVRLWVTGPVLYAPSGMYYVQLAEAEVYASSAAGGSVSVTWIAPGDDGTVGMATSYELCSSTVQADVETFCASAGSLTAFPVGGPAGTPESHLLSGLAGESRYYLSLRALDEVSPPNRAAPSDIVAVDTPGIPPAPVMDLAISGRTATTADLVWTASGDDGLEGNASEYVVCYSTVPLADIGSCDDAAQISVSVPASVSPPAQETTTLVGLDAGLTYYVGLWVEDELDNRSGYSNIVILPPLDLVPPDAVTSLAATPGGSVALSPVQPLSAVGVSSEAGTSWSKEMAVDGDPSTAWSTQGTAVPVEESIVVDLGTSRQIGRVRLLSRDVTGSLFPLDFQIQTSLESAEAGFVSRLSVTGFAASAASWYEFDLSPTFARYVRLLVTRPARYASNGFYYVQLAEIAVDEAEVSSNEMTLSWNASGDDGTVGIATSYQLCYSEIATEVTSDFCNGVGTLITLPVTGRFGTLEQNVVTGLPGESLVHFGVKALDEAGNASAPAFASASTDPVAPAPVTLLEATATTTTSVSLSFPGSGDDGLDGLADHYDLCVSASSIDEANFCEGVPTELPVSGPAGTPESYTVDGLFEGVEYFFAVRAVDDLGLVSPLATLAQSTLDETAPEMASSFEVDPAFTSASGPLVAVRASGQASDSWSPQMLTDGNVLTTWSTPGRLVPQDEYVIFDLGIARDISSLRMRSREVADLFPKDFQIQTSLVDAEASYETQLSRTDFAAVAGSWYDFVLPAPINARYVRLLITATRRYPVNNRYYAQISEVTVEHAALRSDALTLHWIAPHEDGASGGAASGYVLKMSTSPLSPDDLDGAPDAPGLPPSPAMPGELESFTVGGLDPATLYYVALSSVDESGNVSPATFGSATTPP